MTIRSLCLKYRHFETILTLVSSSWLINITKILKNDPDRARSSHTIQLTAQAISNPYELK